VEYYQYYEGLTDGELLDPELIVKIEAAWYCESTGKKFIGYTQLRTKSNKSSIEKIGREISSGTFEPIIKRLSNPLIPKKDRPFTRRSVKVKGKRKKETRLDTNVPLIQKDVRRTQAENYNEPPGTRKVTRFIPKIDKVVRA
jgi:hypothetical protein